MSVQPSMTEQLAKEHITELHRTAPHQQPVPRRQRAGSSVRARSGRLLISLGTRLAPEDARATNRGSKLVGS